MVDVVSPEKRSLMMAGIRAVNTKPELALLHALHSMGLRYRIGVKTLPGKPDIVFPRFNAVFFVHGCFWHRHPGCKLAANPGTREEFWRAKFAANVARDFRVREELMEAGWRVAVVWECSLRQREIFEVLVEKLVEWVIHPENSHHDVEDCNIQTIGLDPRRRQSP